MDYHYQFIRLLALFFSFFLTIIIVDLYLISKNNNVLELSVITIYIFWGIFKNVILKAMFLFVQIYFAIYI